MAQDAINHIRGTSSRTAIVADEVLSTLRHVLHAMRIVQQWVQLMNQVISIQNAQCSTAS
jgi:hypothetical protein